MRRVRLIRIQEENSCRRLTLRGVEAETGNTEGKEIVRVVNECLAHVIALRLEAA